LRGCCFFSIVPPPALRDFDEADFGCDDFDAPDRAVDLLLWPLFADP
jgi:hypothetical protein